MGKIPVFSENRAEYSLSIEVKLFGKASLRVAGHEVMFTPLEQRLLVGLARKPNTTQQREDLAKWVFCVSNKESRQDLRGNLKPHLHNFRKKIKSEIIKYEKSIGSEEVEEIAESKLALLVKVDRDSARLIVPRSAVDVCRFEDLIEQAGSTTYLNEAGRDGSLNVLEAAILLRNGQEILENFQDEKSSQLREEVYEPLRRMLQQRAEQAMRRGAFTIAVQYWSYLRSLYPLEEKILRHCLEGLAADAKYDLAHNEFKKFKDFIWEKRKRNPDFATLKLTEELTEVGERIRSKSSEGLEENISANQEFYGKTPKLPLQPRPILKVLSDDAADPPTTVFRDKAEELAALINRGEPLCVLDGEAGTGKTRVAAALFHYKLLRESQPLWFRGSLAQQELLPALENILVDQPGKRFCVVLDENHRDGRHENFFREFFAGGVWRSVQGRLQILVVLRRSTSNKLSREGVIPLDNPVNLTCEPKRLDQYQDWGFTAPLTDSQREWVLRLASNHRGQLIPFLVVRICARYLENRDEIKLSTSDVRNQIHAVIYRGLVSNQSQELQETTAALSISTDSAACVPLWLIAAVFSLQTGKVCDSETVQTSLRRLADDGLTALLPSTTPNSQYPPYASWQFGHDLIHESVRAYLPEANRIRGPQEIVAAAIDYIKSSGVDTDRKLEEALGTWISLTVSNRSKCLQLAEVITNLYLQSSTRETPNITANSVINACMAVRDTLALRPLLSNSDIFKSFCVLSEIVGDCCSKLTMRDVCSGEFPVTDLGFAIVSAGMASGALTLHPMWEIAQRQVPVLQRIGSQLAESETELLFDQISDYQPKIRIAQLVIWAGDYLTASRMILQVVSENIDAQNSNAGLFIARIHLAACLLLEAQEIQRAVNTFRFGAELCTQLAGMTSLGELYDANAAMIAKWDDGAGGWLRLMNEWQERYASKLLIVTPLRVAVIGNYHDLGFASLITEALAGLGLDPVLIYSTALASLDSLPPFSGFVVVGGDLAPGIDEIVRPVVSPDNWDTRTARVRQGSKFSVVETTHEGRPFVWISGWFFVDTGRAVRKWLQNGVEQFAQDVRLGGPSSHKAVT